MPVEAGWSRKEAGSGAEDGDLEGAWGITEGARTGSSLLWGLRETVVCVREACGGNAETFRGSDMTVSSSPSIVHEMAVQNGQTTREYNRANGSIQQLFGASSLS